MNLLVTGGAGFIGVNVIEHIIDRPEVSRLINLDCLTYAANPANLARVSGHPKYVFEQVDLRDQAAVSRVVAQHGITHVLHLAAESHVDRSIAAPDAFIQSNVVGTFHLLEACRSAWAESFAGKRFHHVSTDEVYGSLGVTGAFTESSPYAPSSPYSASKAAADMLVRAYHRTYGMPVVISNCANNFGPCQHREKLIPVIIASIVERKPIPLYGDGGQRRDWLHVRDHAEALWLVLTRGREGDTYHVGADNEWPNVRLAELICDIADERAPELGGDSRRLISFVADRPGHDRRYAIDATKITRELGWRPAHNFRTALEETVIWYLTHPPFVRLLPTRIMSDPAQVLKDFKPAQEFFVGIDSDGCIFDSMEIKHKECFTPMFIKHFGLQAVSKYAREVWDFVNLYSKTRGANRFPALVRAVKLLGDRAEVRARGVRMPDISALEEWISRETKLGNATLAAEVNNGNKGLEQVKRWSDAVNAQIEDIVHGVPPFPLVGECLEKINSRADALCISQTPTEALRREWAEHGIDQYVRAIAGQEMGTKTEHLRFAAKDKYAPERILMIGDAPGDFKAARSNGAHFFPINPGGEEDSWKRLNDEGLDRFFDGTYAGEYETRLVKEFEACLPEQPGW